MKKIVKKIVIAPFRGVCIAGLWPIEKKLLHRVEEDESPLTFIIGPPRSGTTLLYELLVRRYGFSYISNLAHRLYITPVVATVMGKGVIGKWRKQPKDKYTSKYGGISGWGAPNEGGWIWNRWFPENYYLDETYIKNVPVQVIRKTVYGLVEVLKGPFINKNVMHSVRMKFLNRLFPKCLFIHVRRDIKTNMRSIIRSHYSTCSDVNEWYSVKPREWEKYKNEDIIMRSAAQVYYVHKNIEHDSNIIGESRLISIDYEELCISPAVTLESIASYLSSNGVHLTRSDETFPKLSTSAQRLFDDKTEQLIEECVYKHFK